jgi:hypothetical protein
MFRSLITLLIACAVPTGVLAQWTAYEGFDYPVGSALNGLSGGTGWANNWSTGSPSLTVASGSITPPSPANTLFTTGNRLDVPVTGSFTTASRTLSTNLAAVNGGDVWLSFVVTRTADTPSGSSLFGGVVIGNDAGSGNSGRLFIGDPVSASDVWALQRAGGGATGQSNFVVSDHPTALLVVHIVFNAGGADTVALYVNRAPGGGTPPSADAFLPTLDINPGGGAVTDLGVWYQGYGYQIDEIRIGTSYADVTPVPEPGLVLVVASGFAALRLLRRR